MRRDRKAWEATGRTAVNPLSWAPTLPSDHQVASLGDGGGREGSEMAGSSLVLQVWWTRVTITWKDTGIGMDAI